MQSKLEREEKSEEVKDKRNYFQVDLKTTESKNYGTSSNLIGDSKIS